MTETERDLDQYQPETELALMDATDQARSLAGHQYQIQGHLERIFTDTNRLNVDDKTHAVVSRIVEDLNGVQALAGDLHAAVQGIATFASEVKQQRDKVVKKFVRLRVAVREADTRHPDVKEMIRSIEDGYYDIETEDAKERMMHSHPMEERAADNLVNYLLDDCVPYDRSERDGMVAVLQALIKDIQAYDPTPVATENAASRNQV